jgi:hypothetical protein
LFLFFSFLFIVQGLVTVKILQERICHCGCPHS